MNILVVIAHPDDPEFFCGGTIAKWTSEGHAVRYVVVTGAVVVPCVVVGAVVGVVCVVWDVVCMVDATWVDVAWANHSELTS